MAWGQRYLSIRYEIHKICFLLGSVDGAGVCWFGSVVGNALSSAALVGSRIEYVQHRPHLSLISIGNLKALPQQEVDGRLRLRQIWNRYPRATEKESEGGEGSRAFR